MRYLRKTKFNDIREKYEEIIAWGTGPLFQMNYQPDFYKLNYVIDGTYKTCGEKLYDLLIKEPEALLENTKKKLIVIYAIYEEEILNQIEKLDIKNIDVITYALLEIELENGVTIPEINGKTCEDVLVYSLIKQLHLKEISYIEIGVCHPIIRNNTFLLYELFADKSKGVLVEANPLCWPLIRDYRPNDKLIEGGVCVKQGATKLDFYMFPHLLGHSTFSWEIAKRKKEQGYDYEVIEVDVSSINEIIANNFLHVPDLLALDAEGLDYEILNSLDFDKYPIKILITETMEDTKKDIEYIMDIRGYRQYARTIENIIWVRKEIGLFL